MGGWGGREGEEEGGVGREEEGEGGASLGSMPLIGERWGEERRSSSTCEGGGRGREDGGS